MKIIFTLLIGMFISPCFANYSVVDKIVITSHHPGDVYSLYEKVDEMTFVFDYDGDEIKAVHTFFTTIHGVNPGNENRSETNVLAGSYYFKYVRSGGKKWLKAILFFDQSRRPIRDLNSIDFSHRYYSLEHAIGNSFGKYDTNQPASAPKFVILFTENDSLKRATVAHKYALGGSKLFDILYNNVSIGVNPFQGLNKYSFNHSYLDNPIGSFVINYQGESERFSKINSYLIGNFACEICSIPNEINMPFTGNGMIDFKYIPAFNYKFTYYSDFHYSVRYEWNLLDVNSIQPVYFYRQDVYDREEDEQSNLKKIRYDQGINTYSRTSIKRPMWEYKYYYKDHSEKIIDAHLYNLSWLKFGSRYESKTDINIGSILNGGMYRKSSVSSSLIERIVNILSLNVFNLAVPTNGIEWNEKIKDPNEPSN
ncbi:TPA: hypothetical protein I7784_21760 [Vibrio vulnificus]|nr:hypothetical protein [Vibrio vulnificus]